VLSAIILTLFYSALKPKTLPIYNPADVNPELVDSTVQYINNTRLLIFHLPIKTGKPSPRKITKAKYMLLIFLHNVWFYLSKKNQSIRSKALRQ
jgi:protein SCO1/2